jgi:hypothetical protein
MSAAPKPSVRAGPGAVRALSSPTTDDQRLTTFYA